MESIIRFEEHQNGQESIAQLRDFVIANKISGSDLQISYLLALGVSAEEIGGEINQKAKELAKNIKQLFDQGLALNQVADLVTERGEYENSVFEYSELVSKMHLTDKEKKILNSIVEKERSGTLSIMTDKHSIKIDELEIGKNSEGTKYDIALSLIKFLGRFRYAKGLAIEFSS